MPAVFFLKIECPESWGLDCQLFGRFCHHEGMSIESVIALIREKNKLQEKLESQGCPYPVAESFRVYGHKISAEIQDTFPKVERSCAEIKDTSRVKRWRMLNKDKRKEQNRRAYLKLKRKVQLSDS